MTKAEGQRPNNRVNLRQIVKGMNRHARTADMIESMKLAASDAKNPKVKFTNSFTNSCDYCAFQDGGKHWCQLLGKGIKNMDVKRCSEWKARDASAH